MNNQKTINNAEKNIHFGSISMPKAKGLYGHGKYSLIMVLLYIDSRKRKGSDGQYQYPFEYNAPDIHHNTGVGLKAINEHLRMLRLRGALELMLSEDGKALRTSKGAMKYRVVKTVYEQKWGPNSRCGQETPAGHSEPSVNAVGEGQAGHLEPCCDGPAPEQPGQSGPSANALDEAQAGHSGTSANALPAGHSAPTNDNERIREGKSSAKKEERSALPSLGARAAAALKTGEQSMKLKQQSESVSNNASDMTSKSTTSSAETSSDSAPPSDDPYDEDFCMPASYVARYERHADTLNQHLEERPDLCYKLKSASERESGRIIMNLLNILNLK